MTTIPKAQGWLKVAPNYKPLAFKVERSPLEFEVWVLIWALTPVLQYGCNVIRIGGHTKCPWFKLQILELPP